MNRGFKKLVGKTIRSVSTKALNEVILVDEDGYFYLIEVELNDLGVPVIALKKRKLNKYEVPEKKLKPLQRAKKKESPWPFPSGNKPTDEDKSLD